MQYPLTLSRHIHALCILGSHLAFRHLGSAGSLLHLHLQREFLLADSHTDFTLVGFASQISHLRIQIIHQNFRRAPELLFFIFFLIVVVHQPVTVQIYFHAELSVLVGQHFTIIHIFEIIIPSPIPETTYSRFHFPFHLGILNRHTAIGFHCSYQFNSITHREATFWLFYFDREGRTLVFFYTERVACFTKRQTKAAIQPVLWQNEVGAGTTEVISSHYGFSHFLPIGITKNHFHLFILQSLSLITILTIHQSRHVDCLSWAINGTVGETLVNDVLPIASVIINIAKHVILASVSLTTNRDHFSHFVSNDSFSVLVGQVFLLHAFPLSTHSFIPSSYHFASLHRPARERIHHNSHSFTPRHDEAHRLDARKMQLCFITHTSRLQCYPMESSPLLHLQFFSLQLLRRSFHVREIQYLPHFAIHLHRHRLHIAMTNKHAEFLIGIEFIIQIVVLCDAHLWLECLDFHILNGIRKLGVRPLLQCPASEF